MFISKFMTKAVMAIGPEADITEAHDLMQRHRFRHLPVTREDGRLIGIVSDRDIRSAMPSKYFHEAGELDFEHGQMTGILVRDIMTKDPVTVSSVSTIQDALLLIEKTRVGAFPVVDETQKLVGIISDRDLLNAFIQALGIKEPGVLLGIVVDEHPNEMEQIVRTIISEDISMGSILVARNWRPGKRAVFPYLFAKNIANLKQKFRNLGYEVLDPMAWYIGQAEQ